MDRDGAACLLPHLEPNALVTLWVSAPLDYNPPLWVVAASIGRRRDPSSAPK